MSQKKLIVDFPKAAHPQAVLIQEAAADGTTSKRPKRNEDGSLSIEIWDPFGVISDTSPNFWGDETAPEWAEKLNALALKGEGNGRVVHPTDKQAADGNWDPRTKIFKPETSEVVKGDKDHPGVWVHTVGRILDTSFGGDIIKQLEGGMNVPTSRSAWAFLKSGVIKGKKKEVVQPGSIDVAGYDFIGQGGFSESAARALIQEALKNPKTNSQEEDSQMDPKMEQLIADNATLKAQLADVAKKQGDLNKRVSDMAETLKAKDAEIDTLKKKLETAETELGGIKAVSEKAAKLSEVAVHVAARIGKAKAPKAAMTAIENAVGATPEKNLVTTLMEMAGGDPAKAKTTFNMFATMAESHVKATLEGGAPAPEKTAKALEGADPSAVIIADDPANLEDAGQGEKKDEVNEHNVSQYDTSPAGLVARLKRMVPNRPGFIPEKK